jgi:phosphatidylglycerophosphate synthase
MLDPYIRPIIALPLNRVGKRIATFGFSANTITLFGFFMGVIAIILICFSFYYSAAIFFCFNRLLDGLDGSVARHSQLTDFGGFLDIVCDFIIYSGVVLAFGIANPDNLFYVALLIFSFIGPISSFLAYATLAAKNKIHSTRHGLKSFYYLGGICEGTETAAALILMCLLPQYFQQIALIYSSMCWLTTVGRVYTAWNDFGH